MSKVETSSRGRVRVFPMLVAFTSNPGETGGGPPSGFLTERGSDQTQEVVAALPPAADYSSLRNVVGYDGAGLRQVLDLSGAGAATFRVPSLGLANRPIRRIQ